MRSFQRILSLASALLLMTATASAQSDRTRELVADGDARIEVIAEGAGPLVVLLPSRGRDSEDFDAVAAGIAKAGYRVLRRQPRSAGRSTWPVKNLTLHDFANDVAAVIRHEGDTAVIVHTPSATGSRA